MSEHTETSSADYVIVGAGMAAARAVEGIREHDPSGTVVVLGAEPDPPVYRPDLSKTLWLEESKELAGSVLLEPGDGVELRTDAQVAAIEPGEHRVRLGDGSRLGYRRLLLATGASPRTGPLQPGPRAIAYRTAADYRALREVATAGSHVVVVGGGYIGTEMASALSQQGVRVTLVMPHELVQESMFPESLARHLTQALRDHDVDLRQGRVSAVEATDDGVSVRLEGGERVDADAVVVGLGVTPATELAEQAGIEVDDGIVVDDRLRTSADDVYAAGDAVSFVDPLLGRRRVEHADAAETTGRAAGANMAGADAAYDHTPFFWSDIFDQGYEAIGELSTEHETVEDWQDDEPGGTGVVYYLDQGRVRGVLLWDVWDSVEAARDLIASTREEPVADPQSVRGRIPLG